MFLFPGRILVELRVSDFMWGFLFSFFRTSLTLVSHSVMPRKARRIKSFTLYYSVSHYFLSERAIKFVRLNRSVFKTHENIRRRCCGGGFQIFLIVCMKEIL